MKEQPPFRPLESCRICGSKELLPYLDLGKMPLANQLLAPEQAGTEKKFPLEVLLCKKCFFSQLSIVVDPDRMFRNYVYRSSISRSFRQHCAELASELNQSLLKKNDWVVDIASNDGCLLQEFRKKGNRILGVDPAVNLAEIANREGIHTLAEYWTPALAKKLLKENGPAKAIIAVNVFAHINDVHSFVEGARELLAEDGYFIIESPHLQSLIAKTEFDTIYHEHLSYLLVGPLKQLMESHGLRIAMVKKQSIHGGSIRLYMEKETRPSTADGSAEKIIEEEKKAGLYQTGQYLRFRDSVEKIKKGLLETVHRLKRGKKTIAGFGASAKGNVLLNYCGIGTDCIDFIVDDTPEKQFKLYPGVHIPIVPRQELEKKKPDYLLLLAWNFAEEIMQKTPEFREKGGKYIIPIPEVKVV